ncbi:MAG: DUF4160 domain-containing protein [Nitrospinae bacterium]|nr:DUF4160 domain-containing protein [Nitrospinota bacterium]
MPVIFREKGFLFFFYSNEGEPRESLHVHVRKGSSIAKNWIKPNVFVVDSYGFSSSELNDLSGIIENNVDLIERFWNDYFGE